MKHLMNFNKRKVALSLMAALAWGGVSSVSAEDVNVNFNDWTTSSFKTELSSTDAATD